MSRAPLATAAIAVAIAASLLLPSRAAARPIYFNTFTSLYGLSGGQDLYACGVCHRRWEGTGARNPYGIAIEQQLYVGKTITDAILDVAADDTDGDGTANGDEIATWGTLPGYSCSNYLLAIDPPPNFQSLITPSVASCLEPKDVLVDPTVVGFLTQVNHVGSVSVQIANNGTDFPITVSSYALLSGASPTLGLSGPTLPIVIPVGQSATLDVTFSPTAPSFVTATLEIVSDDPDEAIIDIPITGISFVKTLAPAATRATCFAEMQQRARRFTKIHLKEWGRCYLDELEGAACDTGRRDLRVARAEARLRAFVGGARDTKCAGNGLTPTLLDLPATCGAPCESIAISSIDAWASCLVCRQQAATAAMLQSAVGTVPPDLPANVLGHRAHSCNRSVVRTLQRGARQIQTGLGECALGNVTAGTPVDCATTLATDVTTAAAQVDAAFNRCHDTTDMLGCRFVMSPDPQCLSDAAQAIGTDLVGAVFDTAD